MADAFDLISCLEYIVSLINIFIFLAKRQYRCISVFFLIRNTEYLSVTSALEVDSKTA